MKNQRMAAFRVGLTGGVGSGKSTVAAIFRQLGIPVFDADEVARDLVRPGMPALNRIIRSFGRDILGENGELDRHQLRQRIFNDPEQRSRLEDILHPCVYAELDRRANACDSSYCILCIPLLLETAPRGFVDRVLVVDCAPETQIRRACSRDRTSEPEVRRILAAQTSREIRIRNADDVIDNEGAEELLGRKVRELHAVYRKLADIRDTAASPRAFGRTGGGS